MKLSQILTAIFIGLSANAQTYPPADGTAGTTAIHKDSPLYVAWATGITVERGFISITNPNLTASGSNKATFGLPSDAIGYPDGNVVSLGDAGHAILTFASPIYDGEGFDFAVFENGGIAFLELAVVEASSDGIHFFRFPAHSLTQTTTQIGTFETPVATNLNNIAGKYSGNFGTPFDISELEDNALLDKTSITHIKVIDVVGSIDPDYATFDAFGNAINEAHPTPFNSCGFDLQAVGVINQATLGRDDFPKNTIKIYPNPTKDFFTIKSDEPTKMTIYDISGRIVLEQHAGPNQQVNVSSLTPGVYIVEVVLAAQGEKNAQQLIIN
ncbi:T9SS type A sorting domain-containing protein [Flavobacterium sp. PLA-1-15]|uniref:T9SS type A sorting domain-containing protein n=1 Tax=Flavobacterium sp. PLA-1-15 TaxID=3380533 RepID=UPI003B79562C